MVRLFEVSAAAVAVAGAAAQLLQLLTVAAGAAVEQVLQVLTVATGAAAEQVVQVLTGVVVLLPEQPQLWHLEQLLQAQLILFCASLFGMKRPP